MQVSFCRCASIVFAGAFFCVPTWAAGDDADNSLNGSPDIGRDNVSPDATKPSEPAPPAGEGAPVGEATPSSEATSPGEATPPAPSLAAGVDIYAGGSNLEGFRRFRDGFWAAGAGYAYPSNIYLRWRSRKSAEAKVAVGLGKMYLGSGRAFDQPVEAWYQRPAGKLNLTVGKYYVPFAIQEWQYETKWGAMLHGDRGAYSMALSANYDTVADSPNVYLRVGRNLGENVNVGVSLGAGKGLSYGSIHDRAVGLDVTANWRGWQVLSEYMAMRRESSERFRFGYARLSYEKLGKFKPYIARFSWNDTTGELGQLDSNAIGLSYQLTPAFALEGGKAFTSDEDIWWLQMHWVAEWGLIHDAEKRRETMSKVSTATTP